MSFSSEPLVIEFSNEKEAAACRAELSAQGGEDAELFQKSALAGEAATWIVVATAAVHVLPKILDAVGRLVEKSRVRVMRVGDVEIRNPTAADMKRLETKLKRMGD